MSTNDPLVPSDFASGGSRYGEVCERHHVLKRSCERCADEAEIASLKQQLQEAVGLLVDVQEHVFSPRGFNVLALSRQSFRDSAANGDLSARAANAETAILAVQRFLSRAKP